MSYDSDGSWPPDPGAECPACHEYQNREMLDLREALRDLVDLAEDFRGRGIYAEGEAIIDRAQALLRASPRASEDLPAAPEGEEKEQLEGHSST